MSAVRTLEHTVELEVTDCASCGVVFGVPPRILNARRAKGGSFYCPNGHSLSWAETENDRLREKARVLEARLVSARDQREAAERSNAALRGEITKQKKRAAAGTCPCCKRTFQQLARHMANKHPDHAASAVSS